jgi:hypothetical protein
VAEPLPPESAPPPHIYSSDCSQSPSEKPKLDASGKPDKAAPEAVQRDWFEAAQTALIKRLDAWGTNNAELHLGCSGSIPK